MSTAQNEIRRLMKKAKQHPGITKPDNKTLIVDSKDVVIQNNNLTMSRVEKAIPVGFYDDAVADAKARKVDVIGLAEQQLESEWEAFQEFAAKVEQQEADEEKQQLEETKEREAVEQLENMEYVDRYRLALERVSSLRKGGTKLKTTKRELEIMSEDAGRQAGDVESDFDAEVVRSEYKRNKRMRKQLLKNEKSADAVDPCDWRSRGI
ncbi:uncharacterized protein PHALS_03481 [Plasmopara halstedii]|uniref:ZNF380 coiled-coil domain-containing protein n=1 Tax=Plasmopara halstedii TaxID=4781 RepID=A0A0P1AWK3_PLAHL|nr:uncharacterized protein PHALS_03481 [Plasmopara halstedii]CEG46801.1 hypothetical protein PHALS_03481 [Plasmopara halstedii]|eukprot:XP_024583170.1 hypothetical protein PHALS_03481 [Plasmopara halstedii]